MKNLKTRLLSLVLAVMMIVSMLPATVLADETETTVPEGMKASYTVDGKINYTETFAAAMGKVSAELAKGKDVTVDMYADSKSHSTGMAITATGNTTTPVTLTINMNGHDIASQKGVFRPGYGDNTEGKAALNLVVNGGASAADTTRGTITWGTIVDTANNGQYCFDVYGPNVTVTLNNVDVIRSTTGDHKDVRSTFFSTSYTADGGNTFNLVNTNVIDENAEEGEALKASGVSGNNGVMGTTTLNLTNSVLASRNATAAIVGTVKNGAVIAPVVVNMDTDSAIYHAGAAGNSGVTIKQLAGYVLTEEADSTYTGISKKTYWMDDPDVADVVAITSAYGTGKYATLKDALDAVKTEAGPHVVELLADAEYTDARYDFPDMEGFDLTINMNGKNINFQKGMIRVGSSGVPNVGMKLTINGGGGTITWANKDSTAHHGFELYAQRGELYLKDVTIERGEGTCDMPRSAVYISGAGGPRVAQFTNVTFKNVTNVTASGTKEDDGYPAGMKLENNIITISASFVDATVTLKDCTFTNTDNAAPVRIRSGGTANIVFDGDNTVFNHASELAIAQGDGIEDENGKEGEFFPKGLLSFTNANRRLVTTAAEGGYQTVIAEYDPACVIVHEAANAAVTVNGYDVTYVEGVATEIVAAEENVVVVTPEPGFKVTALYVNDEEVDDIDEDPATFTYAFTAEEDGEYEVKALVKEDLNAAPYTITVTEPVGGTLTVDPVGTQFEGTMVTVTAKKAEGYKLAAVTVNDEAVELVNGAYTFKLTGHVTIAAVFEEVESVLVAGFTAAGAEEVPYYYNEGYTADNAEAGIYTSYEKAFAAAVVAWQTNDCKGTVDLYTNVTISAAGVTTLYNNEAKASNGIFYVAAGKVIDLTLNLNGYTLSSGAGMDKDAAGAVLVSINNQTGADQVVTVNGGKNAEGNNGKIVWGSYRSLVYDKNATSGTINTTVTFNNVDVDKNNPNNTNNGNCFAPNSTGFTAIINGGTWNLTSNNKTTGKIARVGGNTNVYITGGAVINATTTGLVFGSADTKVISVYVDDATINMPGTAEAPAYNLIGVGVPTVVWGNMDGTVTAKATIGDGQIVVTPGLAPEEPVVYAVTVEAGENGTATADVAEAKEGDTVTITVTPAEGFELDTISVTDATLTGGENGVYTFVMPATGVTVTVSFKEIYVAPTTYAVNVTEGVNGTVVADKETAEAGETVKLAIAANSGYVVKSVTVVDANSNEVEVVDGAFEMPTSDVTVTVVFKQAYTFSQNTQIKLIEPWGLKVNAQVRLNNQYIDHSTLVDYGAYFVRASDLSDPNATQDSLTAADIMNNPNAARVCASESPDLSGITVTERGPYAGIIYDLGLYTYEMSGSIFVLFFVEDADGVQYAPIRERNLKSLLTSSKDDEINFPNVLERDVYAAMEKMEEDIVAHRAMFATIPELTLQKAPKLSEYVATNGEFGAETSEYTFSNNVKIQLIEPWGMMLLSKINNATVNYETDFVEYGAIAFHDAENLYSSLTKDQLKTMDDAYVFSSLNGDATVENGYMSIIYNKDIFTYQLNRNLFVMFYCKDAEGNTYYSDVKIRNLYQLASERSVSNDPVYMETEKRVYADMVNVYDCVTLYREDFFANN